MSKTRKYYSRNFLVLSIFLFGSLAGTTTVLRSVFKLDRPFATLYRMYGYHNEPSISVHSDRFSRVWDSRYVLDRSIQ